MSTRLRSLTALLIVAVAPPTVASAQGWIDLERQQGPSISPGSVVRVGSDVRVRIEGRVARVEVEERFRNAGGRVAEGSYLYPLPGEAVFQNFSLWQGEQELKGEMLSAEQARRIYEEIVRQQRDPALLTLAGHGLVRAQVFPIQPGETRRVVLRYVVQLPRTGDALRFRYAFGARGGLGDREGAVAPSIRITVAGAAQFGRPYSPTHQVIETRERNELAIGFAKDAHGDAELLLPLRSNLVGTSVLTHAEPGEDGTFMLLLTPPAATGVQAMPRALTFVVDVSGSMSGDKLVQAKAALRQAVQGLGPRDAFRVIAFSSGVRQFRDSFTPSTRTSREEALQFIDGLEANGGTNIAGALDAAFAVRPDAERLPLVVFLTDGVPSVGEQEPERLAARAAGGLGRTRVFTVGVGHDVNTYLLERLAAEGRGAAEFVAPEADVEVAMGTLLGKLRFPAMTNLRIVSSPVRLTQMEPAQLPDLFFGEELVVFGRYVNGGAGDLVVEGERDGRVERFRARVEFGRRAASNDFLPRLWANRRAGSLTRAIRLEGSTPERLAQLKEFALRYGILTEYTSYLVQEPSVIAADASPEEQRRVELRRNALARRAATAPPPPSAQAGAMAFEAAKSSTSRRDAATLSAIDDAMPASVIGSARPTRQARGRTFVKRDSVWMDIGHEATQRVTRVAAFSEAHLALLRALPELADYQDQTGDVLVAGRRVSLQIGREGARSWKAGELDAVVRSFRGT